MIYIRITLEGQIALKIGIRFVLIPLSQIWKYLKCPDKLYRTISGYDQRLSLNKFKDVSLEYNPTEFREQSNYRNLRKKYMA